jgi:ribosomal protein RSM22 (predicted rRNA methylase)
MENGYGVQIELEKSISSALSSYNLSLQDSRELAKNVLRLSDYFIQNPDGQTPWHESFVQIAYLCYYLPLNTARLNRVLNKAEQRNFFDGLENIIDFGAGLATASLAISMIASENKKMNFNYTLVEKSTEPQKLIENYFHFFKNENPEWLRTFNSSQLKKSQKNPQQTLAIFSYALTELIELPDWALECEALLIAEPSTQQDGRKLMDLREKLMTKGFHPWAPCTHEKACPLLTQSKHDWCHDRIHFDAPNWFQKMEEYLPMKNRTLTTSYLLMRKAKPSEIEAARVVGDILKEKGKDRQMICRGSEREFLAWMHKTGLRQEIPRGELIEIPHSLQKVSNELRVQTEIKEILFVTGES